jgi:hypothetical protein
MKDEAYARFVDYTAMVTIAPFADVPEYCAAMCNFFERWLEIANERAIS